MAEYWPRTFFLMFLDRNGVDVHKHAKKETQNQERELDPEGTKTLITNLPQLIYSRFFYSPLRRLESGHTESKFTLALAKRFQMEFFLTCNEAPLLEKVAQR